MTSTRGKRMLAASVVVAASAWAIGCGGGLSESSTCSDFMQSSPQDQQSIVSQLATKYNKPDYATPLGAPEVPYYCASHPSVTLGQFFAVAGD